jgi:SAM-dependent methyltransferase
MSSKNTCHICLVGALSPLRSVKGYRIDKEYTLYQCQNCKSRSFILSEHPDVDLQAFYNLISKDEAYLDQRFVFSSYWRNEVRYIQKVCGKLPDSVLDVGCRTGDFLLHFPQNVKRVGVELSEYSARVAKSRGLEIYQDYIEDCDFPDQFDAVTAYAVIEHSAKPQIFLAKVTTMIKHNGVLVIMIPSFQTLKARFLEIFNIQWHMHSPPAHLSLYSREFLDNFLIQKGFVLAKRRFTSGGMFNPFQGFPLVKNVFARVMWVLDTFSLLNRFPVFDHMYSYYKKIEE